MNIHQLVVEKLVLNLSLPVSFDDEFYKFLIKKETGHCFEVTLLKNGQYIFVSLIDGENEFPIEHIEFYNNETEDEVIEELSDVLNKLKRTTSKVLVLKETKKVAELYKNGEWKRFGYPGTKVQK